MGQASKNEREGKNLRKRGPANEQAAWEPAQEAATTSGHDDTAGAPGRISHTLGHTLSRAQGWKAQRYTALFGRAFKLPSGWRYAMRCWYLHVRAHKGPSRFSMGEEIGQNRQQLRNEAVPSTRWRLERGARRQAARGGEAAQRGREAGPCVWPSPLSSQRRGMGRRFQRRHRPPPQRAPRPPARGGQARAQRPRRPVVISLPFSYCPRRCRRCLPRCRRRACVPMTAPPPAAVAPPENTAMAGLFCISGSSVARSRTHRSCRHYLPLAPRPPHNTDPRMESSPTRLRGHRAGGASV